MKNRKLQHKHETPKDRRRRHQQAVSASKSFIPGVHDRRWQDGPPPVLLAEHTQMEAQTAAYRDARIVRS